MSRPLRGKTAIVTGASRGIGLAIARELVREGASVVLTARTSTSAEAAAAQLGPQAAGFGAHAADEAAAEACVAFATERFGPVDVLVNNAGTNPAYGPVLDVEHRAFAKTMDVNLWATVLWTRACCRHGMRERGGSVVNIASMGGLVVGANLGVYHASKAALLHLTRQLAVELAPTVRVNALAPGVVRTRLAEALWSASEAELGDVTPLGRIGEPEDIAPAVAFLAGPGAVWITGTTLSIDGGQQLIVPAANQAVGPTQP